MFRLAKQGGPELQHHQCLLDRGKIYSSQPTSGLAAPPVSTKAPDKKTQVAGQSSASARISSEITDFP